MYSGKLIGAALPGLAVIWRDGYRYKKAGVVLLDLHPAAAVGKRRGTSAMTGGMGGMNF
jgi:hypothetical protein